MARSRFGASVFRASRVLGSLAAFAALGACGAPEPPLPMPTTPGALSPAPPRKPKAAKVEAPTPPKSNEITLEALLSVHRATGGTAVTRDRFLFLSDAPGTPQIHLGTLGGSSPTNPVQLTSFPDKINSIRVAPDGTGAVFLKDAGGDENFQVHWLDLPRDDKPAATRALTNLPKTRHSLPVFDDEGKRIAFTSTARNGKDMYLYIESPQAKAEDFAKKPAVELTEVNEVADFAGDQLLLVQGHSNVNQDIWLVDVKKGTKKNLTQHKGDEGWSKPRFSQDRKAIFAISDRGREFMSLVAIDIATGKVTPVVAIEHDVHSLEMAPTTKSGAAKKGPDIVVITKNVDGVDKVAIVTIDDKRKVVAQKDTDLQGVATTLSMTAQADAVFVSLQNATMPPEIRALASEWLKSPAEVSVTPPAVFLAIRKCVSPRAATCGEWVTTRICAASARRATPGRRRRVRSRRAGSAAWQSTRAATARAIGCPAVRTDWTSSSATPTRSRRRRHRCPCGWARRWAASSG